MKVTLLTIKQNPEKYIICKSCQTVNSNLNEKCVDCRKYFHERTQLDDGIVTQWVEEEIELKKREYDYTLKQCYSSTYIVSY